LYFDPKGQQQTFPSGPQCWDKTGRGYLFVFFVSICGVFKPQPGASGPVQLFGFSPHKTTLGVCNGLKKPNVKSGGPFSGGPQDFWTGGQVEFLDLVSPAPQNGALKDGRPSFSLLWVPHSWVPPSPMFVNQNHKTKPTPNGWGVFGPQDFFFLTKRFPGQIGPGVRSEGGLLSCRCCFC